MATAAVESHGRVMLTQRSREGYLLIDHSDSPGVTAEFVRGLAPVVGAGQKYESATKTCVHCNGIVILNPDRSRQRGFCRKCNSYVCDNPWCNSVCRPFTRLIDDEQERAFRRLNYG